MTADSSVKALFYASASLQRSFIHMTTTIRTVRVPTVLANVMTTIAHVGMNGLRSFIGVVPLTRPDFNEPVYGAKPNLGGFVVMSKAA